MSARTERLHWLAIAGLGILLCTGAVAAQFRYPPPAPGGYGYAVADSSLRILVTQKDAAVYVDGYFAGTVDDFDGLFQRLHVTPGQHEIVIYLAGYRSVRQSLYLSPNSTRKISATLEPLAPEEAPESPPVPLLPPGVSPLPGLPQGPTPAAPPVPPPPGERADAVTFGTLDLHVQPAGADVLIDGQPWSSPETDERLIVQLTEGRHLLQIRRQGYRGYSTEVEIRRAETSSLNVSLTPAR